MGPAAIGAIVVKLLPYVLSAVGIAAQSRQSKKNRDAQAQQNEDDQAHEEAMMEKQNQYNIDAFNRTNEYNAPKQQMVRLKEAGLNPHLVYGNGVDATAAPMKTPDYQQVRRPAPQNDMDWNAALDHLADTVFTGQQVQNQNQLTEQQIELMKSQKILAMIEAANKTTEGERKKFDLEFARDTRNMAYEAMALENAKKWADIQFTLDENERQQAMNSANVQLTLQKIVSEKLEQTNQQLEALLKKSQLALNNENLYQKITYEREILKQKKAQLEQLVKVLSQEERIKKAEAVLNERGLQKSDPLYWRQFFDLLKDADGEFNPTSLVPGTIFPIFGGG